MIAWYYVLLSFFAGALLGAMAVALGVAAKMGDELRRRSLGEHVE